MNINSMYKKLTLGLSIFCGITLIWIGVITNSLPSAQAQAYNDLDSQSTVLLAMDSDDVNPIDQVFGSGTTDKVEGKVQKDIGTAQKALDKTVAGTEGTLKQVKGRGKQDIGEVKNRLDNAEDSVEDAGENLFEAAKNLFGN